MKEIKITNWWRNSAGQVASVKGNEQMMFWVEMFVQERSLTNTMSIHFPPQVLPGLSELLH